MNQSKQEKSDQIKNPLLRILHGTVGWIVITLIVISLIMGVVDWIKSWGDSSSSSGDYCAGLDEADCPTADYGMPGVSW